jgi:hypothetical protein
MSNSSYYIKFHNQVKHCSTLGYMNQQSSISYTLLRAGLKRIQAVVFTVSATHFFSILAGALAAVTCNAYQYSSRGIHVACMLLDC